jgi:hypothetical protein
MMRAARDIIFRSAVVLLPFSLSSRERVALRAG